MFPPETRKEEQSEPKVSRKKKIGEIAVVIEVENK